MTKQTWTLVAALAVVLAIPLCALARTATTLPIVADFEAREATQSVAAGRKMTTYEHAMLKEWGYEDLSVVGRFVVNAPASAGGHPPMLVYLHGAGGKANSHYPVKLPGFGPEFLTLSLDCTPAKGPEGWYGLFWAATDVQKYAGQYSPPEHRYLAEIEWVARKYQVDRERIYLWGHSMGGTGTLGLGMARGDIFAALFVGVPAGTDHVFMRMGFPIRTPIGSNPATRPFTGPTSRISRPADYLARISGVGKPDAPPIVNFTSQLDGWSINQENFLQACHDGRHLMVFCWAPFGHTQNYETANPAVLTYPWLSIRRDQAYPVFTDASSDQKYPGFRNKEGDQQGQINGYFRWKNVADEPAQFRMELWLVAAKSIATTRPVSIPESSTVDITPRRLQKFSVAPAKGYSWRVMENDQVVQSGVARPDEVGLLTIPRVTVTGAVRTLTIEPSR